MSNTVKVQEVFGQYAVEIDGKVELFNSEAEATSAAVLAANKAEFEARAQAFTDALGLEGKVAKGKANVIVDFLAFEAGRSSTEAAE